MPFRRQPLDVTALALIATAITICAGFGCSADAPATIGPTPTAAPAAPALPPTAGQQTVPEEAYRRIPAVSPSTPPATAAAMRDEVALPHWPDGVEPGADLLDEVLRRWEEMPDEQYLAMSALGEAMVLSGIADNVQGLEVCVADTAVAPTGLLPTDVMSGGRLEDVLLDLAAHVAALLVDAPSAAESLREPLQRASSEMFEAHRAVRVLPDDCETPVRHIRVAAANLLIVYDAFQSASASNS